MILGERGIGLRRDQFAKLIGEAAVCVKCPAMCERAAVLSELNGPVDARVMFIGEAPGRKGADRTRIPFSGDQSGKNFDRFLASAGLRRSQIFITSAALCNPRKESGANRRPTAMELRNCSEYLKRTIALVDPAVVVTLGGVALEALKLVYYHEFTLKNDAAKLRRWNARLLIPLYHPSPQVLITSRDERAQVRDYRVVAEAIKRVTANKASGFAASQAQSISFMDSAVSDLNASQYSAVRDGGAGWLDLSASGRILVSGSEAVTFLNGLITNDMKALALNSWMTAAFANVQGRLLAVVRVLHRDDGFLIDTEDVTREKVLRMLDRFTLAGDFRVADMSTEIAMLTVQGSQAADVITTVISKDAGGLQHGKLLKTRFGQGEATIMRATHTAEDGFDIFVDANATPQLRDSLTAAGASPVDQTVAETMRIEAGIPRYGVDMDETTIVTETNLDDAVSFTKGCYLGQEIVVRIKHRGHVAKKLTGIVCESGGSIEAEAKIISEDGKEIGRVTSSAFSPRLERTIVLAYVKYDYLAPGTPVMLASGENKITGSVIELPFVRGSWYPD